MVPFVNSMGSFLVESGKRANRPALLKYLMSNANAQFAADQEVLMSLAEESTLSYSLCRI